MYNKLPELTITEQQMPIYRFYVDYPMRDLSQDVKDEIFAQPVPYSSVIQPENFWEWLQPKGQYLENENAYCMFPDGSGYITYYMKFPKEVDAQRIFWYLNWMNFHCKSQPDGTGNIRYKIWNPADHWDHYFVNWRDKSEGICSTESLDLGEGERKCNTLRHSFDLREYGLTQNKIEEIEQSGIDCPLSSDWESFDFEGAHLTLGQIRPCVDGGYERRSCEWIGWRPGIDGEIERVDKTPCSEAYLREVAYHNLLEWNHLCDFINDLYDEYHDKPNDAD